MRGRDAHPTDPMGEFACKALNATPKNAVADNEKTCIRHARDDERPGADQKINSLPYIEASNADTESALTPHGRLRNPGGKIHDLWEEKHVRGRKAVVLEEDTTRVRAVTKDTICRAECSHLQGDKNFFPPLAGNRARLLEIRVVANRDTGAERSPQDKKTAGSHGKEQKIETFTRCPSSKNNRDIRREGDVMGSKPPRMLLGGEQRYRHPPRFKGTLHFLERPSQSAFRLLEIEGGNADAALMRRGHDGRGEEFSGRCTGPSSS